MHILPIIMISKKDLMTLFGKDFFEERNARSFEKSRNLPYVKEEQMIQLIKELLIK